MFCVNEKKMLQNPQTHFVQWARAMYAEHDSLISFLPASRMYLPREIFVNTAVRLAQEGLRQKLINITSALTDLRTTISSCIAKIEKLEALRHEKISLDQILGIVRNWLGPYTLILQEIKLDEQATKENDRALAPSMTLSTPTTIAPDIQLALANK